MADLVVGTITIQDDTILVRRQAAETITVGDPTYATGTDSKYGVADASDGTKATLAGVAVFACATNGYFMNWEGGSIDLGVTLTKGSIVRLSATGITHDATASGSYVSELGVAESTSVLPMDLRNTGVTAP